MRKDPVPNLSPLWPNSFVKNGQKLSRFFVLFTFLAFLTSKMTSKFKFDLIRLHNLGVPNLFVFYDFFVRALLMPQNFILNIFSYVFALFITFLFDFSYISRFSFFLHSYPCRRSSNRVCSCWMAFSFRSVSGKPCTLCTVPIERKKKWRKGNCGKERNCVTSGEWVVTPVPCENG